LQGFLSAKQFLKKNNWRKKTFPYCTASLKINSAAILVKRHFPEKSRQKRLEEKGKQKYSQAGSGDYKIVGKKTNFTGQYGYIFF
jgi:hypothetical protein